MAERVTLRWSGDVDLRTVEPLRLEIDAAIAATPGGIVLDLSDLGFLDSMGIGLLIGARASCAQNGGVLVLRGVSQRVQKLLDLTDVSGAFAYEDSVTGVVGDRLADLPSHSPMDAEPDRKLDRVAAMVRRILGVPTALVSLVAATEQVFPGAVGLPDPYQDKRATPLSHSFCQYVVAGGRPLVVTDARQHPVLAESPAIPDLGVVAYAGMPLTDLDGHVVGALCAIDSEPRNWSSEELATLNDLAALCSAELQVRDAAAREIAATECARATTELHEQVTADLTSLVTDLTEGRPAAGGGTDRLDAAIAQIDKLRVSISRATGYSPTSPT